MKLGRDEELFLCQESQYQKIKNLFLRQSYLDSWEDYQRSLLKKNFIKWDYVILTASNEAQAQMYRMQINERQKDGQLPDATKYVVLPDPEGKRVGSGGATLNVLAYLAGEIGGENPFQNKRVLVIHSGGDSKRVPQYSAIGKLFSPVPHELPDGRGSTLFDEFMIAMSGVPSRMKEGMLVLSGDVLLLFNPLQIDAMFEGAAAISIKESVNTGKNHGVFLNDGSGYVKYFLHKQTEETLEMLGAVNEQGCVDLDTGAVLLDADLLMGLFGLISTNGCVDEEKLHVFVNERARVSFYGDMLYPLASGATLEQYYREKPEGEDTEELRYCRERLWEVLHPFRLKLFCLSPAQFIHFGTTKELLNLVAKDIDDYEFLNWSGQVVSTTGYRKEHAAAYQSYIGHEAYLSDGCYVENSYVLGTSTVGAGSIVSQVKLRNRVVPGQVVIHGLPLQKQDKYVVRIYGVNDNPKGSYDDNATWLGMSLKELAAVCGSPAVLWDSDVTKDLWNARIYPVCNSMEEALDGAEVLYRISCGMADARQIQQWLSQERISLCASFNLADTGKIIAWQKELECRILCRKITDQLNEGRDYKEALAILGTRGMTEDIYHTLMEDAGKAAFSTRIRIYYGISRYMKEHNAEFEGKSYDYAESLCFGTIQEMITATAVKKLPDSAAYRIGEESVEVQLPVRVNWGGGWTDTPPYCNEHGGVVLNAAIRLNGILPVQIRVKRLPEFEIAFESQDVGVKGTVHTVEEIQDCHNPYDSFALHKAALIACGIVPMQGKADLQEILKRLGGGIYLSTQVVGIPKGSGLGTSSILAGACVKGIFRFLGQEKTNEEIYEIVLCMEQIMSTGGGWQDQVGGLTPGIKFITTKPGMEQNIQVTPVTIPKEAMMELQERFALIYTGQRRLARNLLRDVVGGYIGARKESVLALREMQSVAALMKFYLERGDIEMFAELLNRHWELSRQLDSGSTNTCIDQIFVACEDMICGKFIAGAGGGGFIMVILKKGVTKEQLRSRLLAIFQNSGVDVWDSSFEF